MKWWMLSETGRSVISIAVGGLVNAFIIHFFQTAAYKRGVKWGWWLSEHRHDIPQSELKKYGLAEEP